MSSIERVRGGDRWGGRGRDRIYLSRHALYLLSEHFVDQCLVERERMQEIHYYARCAETCNWMNRNKW